MPVQNDGHNAFNGGDTLRRFVVLFGVVCMFYTLLLGGCTPVKTEENSGSGDETVVSYEFIDFSEDEMPGTTKTKITYIPKAVVPPSTSTTAHYDDEEIVTEFFEDPETQETTETRAPNPHITMYLESAVYEPDGIVKFHIVDPTNTGFMSDKHLELLEWDGEEWVKKRRASPKYTPTIYKADPKPGESSIDVAFSIYLSNYENIQRGKRYKITLGVDGKLLEKEFTIASE